MYCGIDVSKNKSNVCILDKDKNVITEFEIQHNKDGFERLRQYLTKDTKIGMEVTGNYSKAIYNYFKEEYNVCYLDSAMLNNFAKLNSPTIKNDKVDARLIAIFLSLGYKTINPVRVNELKDLCKLYRKTVKQLTKYKCMVKDQLNIIFPELEQYMGVKSNKALSNLLLKYSTSKDIANASVEDIHKALTENLKVTGRCTIEFANKIKILANESIGDSKYPTSCFKYTIKIMLFYQCQIEEIKQSIEQRLKQTQYYKLIDEIGYNVISLATIVSEIEDIRRFPNHKKLVGYCGLGITQKQSGSSVNKRSFVTKRGSSVLRHVFCMLTLVHLRKKAQFYEFYNKLKGKGKHPKQCIMAIARKLAIKAYYDMMKCHN